MKLKEKINIKEKLKLTEILNYTWVKKGKDTLQKKALKWMIAFLGIMILCTMLSRFADSLTVPVIKTTSVQSKTMVDELKATGSVAKNREEKISITEGLKVSYVNVNVGSIIKEGDVIAELDMEDLEKKIDDLKENIKRDEKTLSRAIEDYNKAIGEKQASVTRAKNDMNTAKAALDDYLKKTEKEEFVEENLRADYEMKKTIYNQAVADANDTVMLDRILQDTKDSLQLDKYNEDLGKLTPFYNNEGKVLAEKEGVVTSIFASNDGFTSDAIISIADQDTGYKFVGQIDKSNRNAIKQGQSVGLKLSSGVTVDKIAIEAISPSTENPEMLNITLTLPVGVGEIDDSGDIIISSKSKRFGTCVPLAALRQDEGENYFVLVVSEKETVLGSEKIAKKVQVRVEKKDGDYAALTEGIISRNEDIILSSNKNVEDGDRVRLESE